MMTGTSFTTIFCVEQRQGRMRDSRLSASWLPARRRDAVKRAAPEELLVLLRQLLQLPGRKLSRDTGALPFECRALLT